MNRPPPHSLAAVAESAIREGEPYARLREFLDYFYRNKPERRALIAKEPAQSSDVVLNAYLAATAELLAERYRLPIPSWVHQPSQFLHRPHFAGPEGMKAMLLAESPGPFRRRMIFVGYDPLDRPSRRGRRTALPPWGKVGSRPAG